MKEERVVVGYARVSSTTQKDDLERQKQLLHRVYETKRKRLQQKASKKPSLRRGFWRNTPGVRRIGLETLFIS